jgi:long-chain acyl-CoA synthetase
MLLNLWNDVVARYADQVAFRHHSQDAGVTFGEIDKLAEKINVSGSYVPAIGESMDFFPSLIAAWRAGKPVILLENQTSSIRPIHSEIPNGTVLIKQTCGAYGIERSLFFDEAQVIAEGQRNIEGLGLHRNRRGVAAISLAHSYGFGCLALPLLLEGIPLEITAGPMPMFLQPALERGGEVFLPGVPAIWKTCWQTGLASHPAISLALSAGSPLSLELETSIHSECGLKIHNFYGTSETGAIALDRSHSPRKHADFIGEILPGIQVSVEQNQRLAVISDALALGTDIPVSISEFDGPCYLTLDQGTVSDEGLSITRCIGRAINVAGRKVSPTRLKTILEQIEGVSQATIESGKSRDFERFGEIRAHLLIQAGYDKKAIREQLRQRVESWEMPRQWEFEITIHSA